MIPIVLDILTGRCVSQNEVMSAGTSRRLVLDQNRKYYLFYKTFDNNTKKYIIKKNWIYLNKYYCYKKDIQI